MFAAAAVAGAVGGLQHTSKQAEDAQMEKLQQNLAETLTARADPFRLPDSCTPIQGR